jgi:hypothetical protein
MTRGPVARRCPLPTAVDAGDGLPCRAFRRRVGQRRRGLRMVAAMAEAVGGSLGLLAPPAQTLYVC